MTPGRRVAWTLPLGMTETSTYDAAGNLGARPSTAPRFTRMTCSPADVEDAGPTLSEPRSVQLHNDWAKKPMVDAGDHDTYDLRDYITRATPQAL